MNTINFVAHRGLMQHYPENTLISFQKALQAGACYLELDVHLSRDHIPVVIHDALLERTTDQSGAVFDYTATTLNSMSAGYHKRFAEKFDSETIPLLSDVVNLLQQWPQARLFVELKRKSLSHFGRELMLQKVVEVIAPISDRAILISFDFPVMAMAKRQLLAPIGWVFEEWDLANRERAEQLQPDYLFADYDEMPTDTDALWPGPWQWVLYDVVEPAIAAGLIARGAMVESKDIRQLIAAEEP